MDFVTVNAFFRNQVVTLLSRKIDYKTIDRLNKTVL